MEASFPRRLLYIPHEPPLPSELWFECKIDNSKNPFQYVIIPNYLFRSVHWTPSPLTYLILIFVYWIIIRSNSWLFPMISSAHSYVINYTSKYISPNAVLSAIWNSGKYEGITFRSSTRWCVIVGLKNLKPKEYTSPFVSSNIACTIYIATIIHKIQATGSGKGIWHFFFLQFILSKYKPPSWQLQGIIFSPKQPSQTSTFKKIPNWRVQLLLVSM